MPTTQPKPEFLIVIERFNQALEARWFDQAVALAEAWKTVEEAIRDELEALTDEIASESGLTRAKLYRMARLQRMLTQVDAELRALVGVYEDQVQNQMLQTAADSTAQAAWVGQLLGVEGSFDRINTAALRDLLALSMSGAPLRNLLENAYAAAADGIITELIKNTALGRNPREIAKYVTQNGLSNGMNHLLLVSRDQQLRAYRMAALETYRQAGVERVRRVAAKSLRTCFMCLYLDGKVYDINEQPEMHPQDRCSFIPFWEGWQPEWTNGVEWLKGIPENDQRTILGRARWELWRKGTPLREMYDVHDHATWGPTLRQIPLKELKERANA